VPIREIDRLEAVLGTVDHVIVDLTARAYDGLRAITVARTAGLPILAIGQHDDVIGRRAALDAGAARFLPYRRLIDDGPTLLAAWLDEPARQAPAADRTRRPA
jgi:hypothetical protein